MPESGSGEVQRKEAEGLVERQKAKIDAQTAEIVRLRSSKERYARRYRETKERITELDLEFREVRRDHEEALEKRDRRVQAATDELAQIKDELQRTKDELARTKDELTQAKEPPAGGSTESAETQHQSSSSMTHSPSEGEVLGVVRDLNEIIFQVAANLTEEWEKRGSSWYSRPNLTKEEVDSLSQFYGPTLLRQALGRDPTAMTFLVQSCLCYLVTQIALGWRRDHDSRLWALGSVYKRLSASGECMLPAANERGLTDTRGSRNLSQVEVFDPKAPPHITISSYFDRTSPRGRLLDHRVVSIHSGFIRFRQGKGVQWDRNRQQARSTLGVLVHGRHHIQ